MFALCRAVYPCGNFKQAPESFSKASALFSLIIWIDFYKFDFCAGKSALLGHIYDHTLLVFTFTTIIVIETKTFDVEKTY